MTMQERQEAAVSMAVHRALLKMGLASIKRSEFFGMKQQKQALELKDAA